MADPIVHITNGIPDVGTGNITTLGQTLLDGANLTLGITSDAAVAAGATGTINAHLRSISRDLVGGIVLQAGANTIGTVNQGAAPWSVTVSSGTIAATQSGSWSVSQTGTWNINNISGTVSLPTGAATAAKQPLPGIAGTPSADVITVQGSTSMTALKVDGSAVIQPVSISSGNVGITGNVNCVQVTSPWVTSVTGNVTCVQSGNWAARCVGNAGGIFDFSSAQNVATPAQAILIGAEFNAVPTTITTGNSSPLQLDSAANLLVNVKAGTVAATQSGTWNINNISGTISLPTGAATSANQPTNAAQGSTTSGQTGTLSLGAVTTGNPTYTTGQTSPISLDTSGAVRVNVIAGSGGGGTSSSFGSAMPATGTAIGLYDGTNMVRARGDETNGIWVNIKAGAGSGGTASNFGSAVPSAGTAAGFSDGTNMQLGHVFDLDTGAGTEYNQGVILRKAASGGSVVFGTSTDPIRVDPTGATTQPVSLASTTISSGTVAATQSGTWTVQPGNTANTTPWLMTISQGGNSATVSAGGALKVDGSAVTQPISAAALPLPSGAATSANQPSNAAIGSTTLGQTGNLSLGAVTTAAPTYTTAQSNPLSLTTAGALRVDGSAVTQPVSGTFWQATQPVSGTVTSNQGGAPWTVKPDGTAWAMTSTSANVNVTNASIAVTGTFWQATQPVSGTVAATQSGTWTVQPGNTANTTAWLVTGTGGTFPVTGTVVASGDAASGAADTGNPIKIGVVARTTNPTAVTNGQRVNLIADKLGKLVAVGAIRDLKGVQKTSISVATETTVVTAGAAGVFNDVYAIVITNKSATAVFVDFKDATAGTTRMTLAAPANDTRGFTVPVDSAMVQAVAANNWTATVSSAVTSIEISMLYVSNL